jgi:hypothetical protein
MTAGAKLLVRRYDKETGNTGNLDRLAKIISPNYVEIHENVLNRRASTDQGAGPWQFADRLPSAPRQNRLAHGFADAAPTARASFGRTG